MADLCVVCHAHPEPVCPSCRKGIDDQLAALPGKYVRLAGVLAPGRAPIGEHVAAGGHVHPGLPVRDATLSLLGPGADVPPTLQPVARRWCTKRKMRVTTHANGYARIAEVEVTDWFHEYQLDDDGQPLLAETDDEDQVGVAPPREWLDQQARRWRSHFGHHVPARTMLGDTSPYVPAGWQLLLRFANGPQALGLLAAIHHVHHARGGTARLAYRGLLAGRRPSTTPGGRAGGPPRSMGWDVDYLRTWLEKACGEPELGVAGFAAELRALNAEISRALGELPDRSWIGRCPAFLDELDRDGEPTGRRRPCGGGLWEERGAYLSAQVVCPRCHITWETRGHAGAGTAREIRRVWPLDRRRRYKRADIARLTLPRCPGCGRRVRVDWREVTGTRDPERTWQATRVSCASDCEQARRLL